MKANSSPMPINQRQLRGLGGAAGGGVACGGVGYAGGAEAGGGPGGGGPGGVAGEGGGGAWWVIYHYLRKGAAGSLEDRW
jgi:hypothetical protein